MQVIPFPHTSFGLISRRLCVAPSQLKSRKPGYWLWTRTVRTYAQYPLRHINREFFTHDRDTVFNTFLQTWSFQFSML